MCFMIPFPSFFCSPKTLLLIVLLQLKAPVHHANSHLKSKWGKGNMYYNEKQNKSVKASPVKHSQNIEF